MMTIKIYFFIIKTDILYPPLLLFICCGFKAEVRKDNFRKEKSYNAFLVAEFRNY